MIARTDHDFVVVFASNGTMKMKMQELTGTMTDITTHIMTAIMTPIMTPSTDTYICSMLWTCMRLMGC